MHDSSPAPAPVPPGAGIDADMAGTDSAAPLAWLDPDGRHYWFEGPDGSWARLGERQTIRRLQIERGLESTRRDGQAVSEIDAALHCIEKNHRLAYVGALAGWQRGIHMFAGYPALVAHAPSLLTPAPGNFPTIAAVFQGLFDGSDVAGDGIDQRPYFLAYLKHALAGLYDGKPSQGLALALAGDRDSGKTLLVDVLVEAWGGQRAYPYRHMTNRDSFNSELFGAVAQVIDDENADTRIEARRAFAASIKQVVAVDGARCRGMHREAVTLFPHWRLLICLNREPERLMVLPPLDSDLQDKMLILLAHKRPMPMPVGTDAERRAFWSQLKSELPALIHHLLHEYDPGEIGRGRFGCEAFQHPMILDELFATSPAHALGAIIDRVLFPDPETDLEPARNVWRGKAEDLSEYLLENGNLPIPERKRVPADSFWMGRRLGELRDKYPDRFRPRHTRCGNVWTITRAGWPLPDDEA